MFNTTTYGGRHDHQRHHQHRHHPDRPLPRLRPHPHQRASIARHRGPVCHARVAAAARTTPQPGYKPEALDKAADLIEQAAIVPAPRPGLYHTVSSDGTTTYLTHACGCTCPAGRRGRACYHRAAARILDAATRRATRSALRLAA